MKMTFFKITVLSLLSFFFIFGSATSREISYQGRLLDPVNQPVTDGNYQISFLLFDDSTNGNIVWAENSEITTTNGFFNHNLGTNTPFGSTLFQTYDDLYLELRLETEIITPRTKLNAVAFAMSASNLKGIDSLGLKSIQTDNEAHKLTIFDSNGDPKIVLRDTLGDNSVILPDFAVNSREILNEPGLAASINIELITLSNDEMNDLVEVSILTPADGYIVLYGKCYLLLSGTTGPNNAIIQIDENEGGGTQFPYYSIAGLSGYTNSGTNYFPVFVTRIYYKKRGSYTFRLEGRASFSPPAVAQSWDHVLTAVYYPTSYYTVSAIADNPLSDPTAIPIIIESSDPNRQSGTYYKVDLQKIEMIETEKSEK